MGKKSFKSRHLAPGEERKKTPVAKEAAPLPPLIYPRALASEDEFERVDHSALNHGFECYSEALKRCVEDGWEEAVFAPCFSSTALVDALNRKLQSDVRVHDRTLLVPTGCAGNYSVVPLVAYQLCRKSTEDDSQAFMLMRTKANTPAFLCGCMATHAAMMEGDFERARDYVRAASATPAGFLVHNGKQLVLPTLVCQGNEEQAASLLAAMLDNDPDKFCCAACEKTLMSLHRTEEKPSGTWSTMSFVAFDCGHAFHVECLHAHYKQHGHCCPHCPKTYVDHLAHKLAEAAT